MSRAWLACLSSLLLVACVESEEPGGDFRQLNFNQEVYDRDFADETAAHHGAKLYDHWFTPAQTPSNFHPLWEPSWDPSVSVEDSWRCSTCHGWDFSGGKTVALDTEGNRIPIPETGLLRAHNTMAARDIYATIKYGNTDTQDQHAYQSKLADADIYRITRFIKTLTPPSEFINTELDLPYISLRTGRALGNLAEGEVYYRQGTKQNCISCHNETGVSSSGRSIVLGELAIDEPWQFLHRLQHGIPHSTIISFEHDIEDFLFSNELTNINNKNAIMANILTYAQYSLSRSVDGENVIRGGLLYDDFFLTKNITAAGINPQWQRLFPNEGVDGITRTNEDTWRCSSCHSWNYVGRSVDIPSLLVTVNDTIANIRDVIANGVLNEHDYKNIASPLSDQDIIDLAYFIQQEIVSVNLPNLNGTQTQGERGKALYEQVLFFSTGEDNGECVTCPKCVTCHQGGLGQFTSNESLYSRINQDRFRSYHRIRFGNPGFGMVGTKAVGLPNQDAQDLMIYINLCLNPLGMNQAWCTPPVP